MKKKLMAALTAMIVLAASVLPGEALTAQAATLISESAEMYGASSSSSTETDSDGNGVTDNGFSYSLSGDTATITGYSGTATSLTVPLTISVTVDSTTTTYDVTAIGGYAFAGNAGLTSVTMQGGSSSSSSSSTATGLLTIGDMAFYGCPSLTTVTIPATVTSIGSQAFSDCPALTALTVTAGNQSYVSYDGVLYQYIGYTQSSSGSYNTYTLIQYPSGKSGTSYSAPASVASRLTTIGQGAFAGAESLTSITLPDAVETINSAAFQNCSALTSITIPDKVTAIPTYAFSGCSSLSSVGLSDNITSIGAYAFQNCYALDTIALPSSLTSIGNYAFYGCSGLTDVTIPSGVTSLGACAFAYCTALAKITIPATVTSIGSNIFLGVNGLTIYCPSGSQAATYAASNKIGTVTTYTVKFVSDTGTVISTQQVVYGSAAEAPAMTDRPGYKLSWSTDFSKVTSDLTVTAVYTRVYTVTFIDKYSNKTATDEVAYGASATAPSWTKSGYTLVWSTSFSYVTSDLTVYATWKDPATGFVIDGDTVKPAAKGSELTKGTVTYLVTSANVQNPKVEYVSNSNTALTSVSIPNTVTIDGVKYKVTSIADGAFRNNTALKSVTIGTNVTSIGTKAFCKCTSLSKIKIKSKKLSTIGNKAFYGIKNNAVVSAYQSKLTAYKKLIKSSGVKSGRVINLKAIS